jgi:hypothetical protein
VALCAVSLSTAQAGEWLGGQYWGQIGGCGHCGGSLYGGLYGLGSCCTSGCGYDGGAWQQAAPPVAPFPQPILPGEAVEEVVPIPDPQPLGLDVIPTTHIVESSRRSAQGTFSDILPIAPSPSAADVKTITHTSRPERLAPPTPRIVAPNAWSAPLYR